MPHAITGTSAATYKLIQHDSTVMRVIMCFFWPGQRGRTDPVKLIDDVTGTPHWNQEFSLYDLFPIFLQPEAVFFNQTRSSSCH